MNIKLDPWQEKFIKTEGNKILCTGRQVGKSVVCGIDGGEWAMNNRDKNILMIAPTERQAYDLFEKTLNYILDENPKAICKGKDRPTKTKMKLTNGTTIWCLPVGISGLGIRGKTIHRLYADEASRIPDNVWTAVTPMLLTTGGGARILLSTPAGKQGYFYKRYIDDKNDYSKFETNSENIMRTREICSTWTVEQRDASLELLKEERRIMTQLQYAQEYEGLFIEEVLQFFSDDLISSCMRDSLDNSTTSLTVVPNLPGSNHFLGVDVARMGGDETVLLTLERTRRDMLIQKDMDIFKLSTIPQTYRRIVDANSRYDYQKIYIDDGGLGVGVSDLLLEDEATRRKTVPINNASKKWNAKKDERKLMKEELYCHLKVLMEQGRIKLWRNDLVFQSLKSVQAENTNDKLKIWGKYTHITEALIRAAWCMKDKSLNIWVY